MPPTTKRPPPLSPFDAKVSRFLATDPRFAEWARPDPAGGVLLPVPVALRFFRWAKDRGELDPDRCDLAAELLGVKAATPARPRRRRTKKRRRR